MQSFKTVVCYIWDYLCYFIEVHNQRTLTKYHFLLLFFIYTVLLLLMGFPVHHQRPEFAQTHDHRVDEAIHGDVTLLSSLYLLRVVKVKSLRRVRLFVTPVDCSLPGSSVHGILQARILVWVTISFSRGSSQRRDRTRVSRIGGRCFNLWANREAWSAAVHGVARSQTRLSDWTEGHKFSVWNKAGSQIQNAQLWFKALRCFERLKLSVFTFCSQIWVGRLSQRFLS